MTPGPPLASAIGVDVGGTKVLGVRIDAAGRVAADARVPTPQGPAVARGPVGAEVVAAVAEVVDALGDRPGAPGVPVGVGVPGMVDRQGVLRFAPHLPAAAGADIGGLLRRRLPGTPVTVENDATLALLAEHRLGAAQGVDDVVLVTLGTGIGGGLLQGGTLRTGAHGFAGELGHLVVDPSGPPCPCGRRGCWERFASGGGLGRLAREAAQAGQLPEVVGLAGGDPEDVRGEHVTAAARAGDPGALAVIGQLGWWVALGLANLVAVVDPSMVVLGGGLAAAGDILLEPIRAAFDRQVEGARSRPAVAIVPAELGEGAGAVGAALGALGR